MLWILALLGLALRLGFGLAAPCYWDEGYMAELAACLGRFERPQVSGLWHYGFLPFSTSLLAPLSAAPLTWIPGLDALQAVRLWAALLSVAVLWPLRRLGEVWGGRRTGIAAAVVFALAPPAFRLGGMGLYHALATLLAVWAVTLSAEADQRGEATPRKAMLLAGIALAACYWLWWLAGVMGLRALRDRSWKSLPGLALGALPLILVVALQLGFGGEAAWQTFQALRSGAGSAWSLSGVLQSLLSYPLLPLGLLGLFFSTQRWLALALAFRLIDLLRQRGDLGANAYALLPGLPFLMLGLAQLLNRALQYSRMAALAAVLAMAWAFSSFSLATIRILSTPLDETGRLRDYLATHADASDTVLGWPAVNWALHGICRPVEPAAALAAQGLAGGYLPAGLAASAFSVPAALTQARYLVLSHLHFQALLPGRNMALLVLQAESEGWPLVHQGRSFGVYAKPGPGVKADKQGRLVAFRDYYGQAALDAEAAGLPTLAAFARGRMASARPPMKELR